MSLRVRFQYQTSASLNYSIERLSDGLFWDFAASGVGTGQTFTAIPGTRVAPFPEDTGSFRGRYKVTLATTPAVQFTDGDYCVTIHDGSNNNAVVAELVTSMHGGDDAPVFPPVSSLDPWAIPTAGYTAGTFGSVLAANLDARVSSRMASFFYTAPDNPRIAGILSSVGTNLNTLAGGIKAKTDNLPARPAAAGPVQLTANGLDAIVIEPGVNARQALVPILAAACGPISGAGTGTILVDGGNTLTTRMTIQGDSKGNRFAVALNLSA